MTWERELLELKKVKDSCTICGGSGYSQKEENGRIIFEDCSCVLRISKKLELIEANIPPQYWDFDFRNLTRKFREENSKPYTYLKNYLDNIKENVAKGKSFWLASSPGLAKSSIICYFLREAIKSGKTAYYSRTSHIISKKFEAFGNEDTRNFLEYLVNDVDIIALEEIEKVRLLSERDMINHLFNELISDLYDRNKAVLISSNIPRKEVLKMFPTYIQDRLSTLDYFPLLGKHSGRRGLNVG